MKGSVNPRSAKCRGGMYLIVPALVITTSVIPNACSAQAASVTEYPEVKSENSSQVDSPADIVVTATRRAERLQDIPASVTAVSGKTISESNYTALADIQYLAPGLSFTGTAPFANSGGFFVRGVGTQASNYATEQTVGIVVDGVVLGLPRDPGVTGFSDIERVEVLRGPQGTLFGKNASAGLISIVTKQPEIGVASFDGHLRYGSRDEGIVQANANVPLGDRAAARVSTYYQTQDGPVPNVLQGWNVGDNNSYGVRGKVRLEPTETLTISLAGEYQYLFSRDPAIVYSFGTSATYRAYFDGLNANPPKVLESYIDKPWTAKSQVYGFSGQIDLDVGDHTLTSVTAYRHFQLEQFADLDGAPIDYFNFSSTINHDRQITQELRLASPAQGSLQYVVGAFFYDTTIRADETQIGGLGTPSSLFSFTGGGTNNYVVKTQSKALFGQATYKLTNALRLIGGLRYTHDEVTSDIGLTRIPGLIVLSPTIVSSGRVTKDNLSGKAGVQYDFTPSLMAYATYGRGYKGPAINIIQGSANPLRPEISDSYEVGLKSTLLNGHFTLNGALFWEDFKDFQAQTLTNTIPYQIALLNAGKLRTRGFEVEAKARLTSAFTLSGNVTYVDATYLDFLGPCYAGEPVSPVPAPGCYNASGTTVADRAGYRLPNSPRWSYSIAASYEAPIFKHYRLSASTNWSWRSSTLQADLKPDNATNAYGLLNASLRIGPEKDTWTVGVYVRNAFDQRFFPLGSNDALDPGGKATFINQNAFRTVGASLDFKL